MKKTWANKVLIFVLTLFFGFSLTNKTVFAEEYGGYDKGYSDWSDTRTGRQGEVQRTVWRYADANFKNSCVKSRANLPQYYADCWWDPYNCYYKNCNSWLTQSDPDHGECNRHCCLGVDYAHPYPTYYKKCYDGTSRNPGQYCYPCKTGSECQGWSEGWDGPCGNTQLGYKEFASWGAWSPWSTTQYYDSHTRKVEWKYQYSYPYPPVLALKTAYYFVGDAVSINDLKANAVATDICDGVITPQVQFVKLVYENGTVETDPTAFVDTTREQTIELTCKVTNSRNLTTTATKEYHIYDLFAASAANPNEVNPDEFVDVNIYDRFISDKYMDSVNENSLWDTDDAYKQALQDALNSTSGTEHEVN